MPVPLYGDVPPLAATETEPLLEPLQETFDTTELLALRAVGWEMVMIVAEVQPLASVTI